MPLLTKRFIVRYDKTKNTKVRYMAQMERELVITGTAASSGRSIGTVVHFDNLDNALTSDCDLIVVGEMIPPNVVTFAERVKGLITDEGGILSHAATVAREFLIPCVVGTENATEVLQSGDTVEVIGEKGEVYRV